MYLGFQALYLTAMVCYVLAFVSEWNFTNKVAASYRDADLGDHSLSR
jgi:hypothetical protein